MNTLATLIVGSYAIITLAAVLIIIYLIIKEEKRRGWKILKEEIIESCSIIHENCN